MRFNKYITNITVILCIGYYLIDAVIDAAMVYDNLDFSQVLITAVPYAELYSRLLAIAMIIILGILVSAYQRKNQPDQVTRAISSTSPEREIKYSGNPRLMVNVSNHIRTPLNAIRGFVELLRDPDVREENRKSYINHIEASSNYLLDLVNNLTDITLLEGEELKLERSDCSLNTLLSDLHSRFSAATGTKKNLGIILKTNVQDRDFTIPVDEKRLSQVMANLLENAILFTEEGTIEFGYNLLDNNKIRFFVRDDGAGIPAERLEEMFSKISGISDSRTAPFDLVTLRIHISRRLIRLMGGELEADSSMLTGSAFSFVIAYEGSGPDEHSMSETETETKAVDQEMPGRKKGVPDWSGKTLLIAEDVESNYIYLEEILGETGLKILWAEDGKEAIEKALSNPGIDLVLMDILMPEMDGYEATVGIKKELPNLPVIAQTACQLDETDYKDAKHYFDRILVKPIWSHDLLNTLEQYFGS